MDPKKQRALVEYLMRQDRPVTAKELADFLNFSVRTVKSYISDINRCEKIGLFSLCFFSPRTVNFLITLFKIPGYSAGLLVMCVAE